jgi:peptide/nickel transport system permease protein
VNEITGELDGAQEIKSEYRALTNEERAHMWILSAWEGARNSWKIYRKNRLAVLGLVMLLLYVLMAVLHPLLIGNFWPKVVYDPVIGHDMLIFPHPSGFSRAHLLGTDVLGRDVLSILMAATAPSLEMAFTAALTAAVIGILVGAFSAYFRGWVDTILTHIGDISLLAPAPLVMVVIGFMFDITPVKFGLIYGVLVGFGAVGIVLRSHAFTLMRRVFIEAAVVAGGGGPHIIFRHLVPHMLPLAAVNMLLTVTGAIFASGFIAFMGLSRAQLNWGSMIYDAITYLGINGTITWNVLVPSAMAISLFASSFYLIALGLHDVVDPRLSGKSELLGPESGNVKDYDQSFKKSELPHMVEDEEKPVLITCLCVSIADQAGEIRTLPRRTWASRFPEEGLANRTIISDDGRLLVWWRHEAGMDDHSEIENILHAGVDLRNMVEDASTELKSTTGPLKISLGVATSESEDDTPFNLQNSSMIFETSNSKEARILEHFARSTKNGTLLINEKVFILLGPARDRFVFGRKGLATIPDHESKIMIYEVLDSSN